MDIVVLYDGEDGESHFANDTVELSSQSFAPPAHPIHVSDPIGSRRMLFFSFPEGWYGEPHRAPKRQYCVLFTGELELIASDGTRRSLSAGQVALLGDVSGKGHASRNTSDGPATGMFVQVD